MNPITSKPINLPNRAVAGYKELLIVVCAGIFCMEPLQAATNYHVERPVTTLALQYESVDERRTSPTIEDRSEDTDTFRQRLNVEGGGWWYHPDFLSYSFGLDPEWEQQTTKSNDDFKRDDDSNFLGYYLDARFFQKKPQSLNLFLRQAKNNFDSTLSPDSTTRTDIARGVWSLREYTFPTIVTIERNNTDFEDFFRSRDDSDIFRVETKHETDKSQSHLRAEYVDQDRQISTSKFSVERSLLNVGNTFRFDDDTRLFSSFYGIDSSSDDFDNSSYYWSERLLVDHRPDLRGDYQIRFDERDNDGFESDTTLASASLQHELYENLTTTVSVEGSRDDFTDGQIDVYETDLDFRYTRRIPIGRLNINNGYAYRLEDNDIDTEASQVINERVILVGTQPVFLNRINVDMDSIVVTDVTSSVIYVLNIDYLVTEVGTSTAIQRTLLGGIANGETVLVDYTFAAQAPFKTDRKEFRLGASVDMWHMLRVFYNLSRTDENLKSGTQPSDLADDTIQRIGGELRWRWSTTYAEFEDRDTVRAPLDRFRIQESLLFQPFERLSLGLSAGYTETDFKEDTGSDTKSTDLSGNIRWQLGRWGEIEARAYSRTVDGDSQNTDSDGLIARWGWRYGDWAGSVRYETLDDSDDLTDQTRDRDMLTIYVSRLFR